MKLIIILFLPFSLNFCFGQEDGPHQIDQELNSCLDSIQNFTSEKMIPCISEALDSWNNVLNKNYKELELLLSEKEKEKLSISQKKWTEHLNEEVDF